MPAEYHVAKPSTFIRDTILAQRALLQDIAGGADWHSAAGNTVLLRPSTVAEPPLHIAMAGWRVDVREYPNAVLLIMWNGVVPIDDDDDIADSLVLADMLEALTAGGCAAAPGFDEIATEPRDSGSNYAVVAVTTRTHFII